MSGITAAIVASVDAPKPTEGAAEADPELVTAAVVPSGIAGRIGYGFGAIGSHLVGGLVLSMATSTQNELQSIRTALKRKPGMDGDNARNAARVAEESSRLAIQSVYTADPVRAVRNAMKAKNHLDVAKHSLSTP